MQLSAVVDAILPSLLPPSFLCDDDVSDPYWHVLNLKISLLLLLILFSPHRSLSHLFVPCPLMLKSLLMHPLNSGFGVDGIDVLRGQMAPHDP